MAPLRILHVEDDPDDAFFFSRAMKNAVPECELHRELTGEGAIEYLRKASLSAPTAEMPLHLMALDLKLPGLSGFEVLSWTRAQDGLKKLPIIILSGSSLVLDKSKASELGASEFIVKNSDYDQIAEQVVQFISRHGRLESNAPAEILNSPQPRIND
jgi:DNA-binding response OmpR family regulator